MPKGGLLAFVADERLRRKICIVLSGFYQEDSLKRELAKDEKASRASAAIDLGTQDRCWRARLSLDTLARLPMYKIPHLCYDCSR